MKKTFYTMLLGLSVMGGVANAQCPEGRYTTDLFPTYTVSTVTYSTVYNLQMDIYQPDGDTYPNRPVMILGHGGSFIGGNKTADRTVVELCKRFAKRGFVTASINYRLGTFFTIADSASAIDIVVKAISDGKAAVRYFVKDAATANVYHIDTNNIFVGGNSAGAVLFMHVGYLSDISECPDYIVNAMAVNGGFEGNSGNDGYTTRTRAVVNLAGALNKTSFINTGDKPSVNAQGTDDNTVPYYCDYPLGGIVQVNLCGLGEMEAPYTANGIYHMSKVYTGLGHVPWDDATPEGAVMMNSVDSMVKEFAYNLICTDISGVKEATAATEVLLYPNPAGNTVNISAGTNIGSVLISDQTGRTVHTATGLRTNNYNINTSMLAPGIYFVRASFTDGNITPVVKRLVIE